MKHLALIALIPLVLPAQWRRDSDSWTHEDHEAIHRTFTVGADSKVLVDTIQGFIHVTGYDGNQIQVDVNRQTRAESDAALAEAKREVKLDMEQVGNTVKLYVDGPFRNHGGINYRGDNWYGYRVRYDFEIRVPRAALVDLHNLNDPIEVKGTSGDFSVHGLNGGIDMEGVSGSGEVHTLNGKVRVSFAQNPRHDCQFHTLNGSIDVYFKPPLNADLDYHTLNGGVYADFDVSPTSSSPDQQGGRYLYRSGGSHSGRAGSGGPKLSFHGLNGAIRLHTTTL